MADDNDRVAMLSDLNALEARLDARFEARLNDRLSGTVAELRRAIADEAADTRRHFDIMVERMSDMIKPIADGFARVLDDHESRPQQLENRDDVA